MARHLTKPRFSRISGIFVEFPGARARCGYCSKVINVTDRLIFHRTVVVHIICLLNRWKQRLEKNKHNKAAYEGYITAMKTKESKKIYGSSVPNYIASYEINIKNSEKMIEKWTEQITSLVNFIKNDPELSMELTSSLLEEGK